MTLLDDTREDLQNDLFSELGTSVTIYTLSTRTTDKWGDETTTYDTATIITAVPYNQGNVKGWEKFGTLQSEVIELAVPYTTTPTMDDIYLYDGIYYEVGEINKYPLLGGNLVTTVVLYKSETQSAPVSVTVYVVDTNTNLLVDTTGTRIVAP